MKKIVVTLLIALFIAFGIVTFKNVYSCNIPIHNRGINAVIDSGDLDVLFIGSSTFRSNIDMEVMDEAYDGNAFILSYGGNQYIANKIQYDELKKRSNSKYDLMVFEFDPLLLTEEVKLSDSRVIWDLSWDGKKKLWDAMASSGDTNFSLMYEYFVTSGIDDLVTYPVTEKVYATRYYKGAKTSSPESPGKEALENEKYDISDSYIVEAQMQAITELIEECQKDGQNFLFLECPHYKRLESDPVYQEYYKDLKAVMDKYNVTCILASDVDFDNSNADYFEDMSHMSGLGRLEYTKKLVNLLADY